MKRWDVLGFGSAAVDDLLYLDGFPVPDAKMPVIEEGRAGGGLVATGLVAAARLGASAAYAAVLGYDELSLYTLAELEREGVDCSPVVRRTGARPYHSVILVDCRNASRTILYSAEGVTNLVATEVSPTTVAAARLVFVDSTIPELAVHVTRLAHTLGVPVLADIERLGGELEPLMALVREVDHIIVGTQLAYQATGEKEPANAVLALQRLGGRGRAAVVVTGGERGAWYTTGDGDAVTHRPAFQVAVVDTTGCGDVFHGAYASAIARGESIPIAIDVATAAAGLKATQRGGRAGIPNRATVDRFLRESSREQGA